MQTGPKIKLDVNLHRMDKYFPLDFDIEGGYDYDRIIDRKRFDEVAGVLKTYKVTEDHIIKEFCFILGWIERETAQGNGDGITLGKYEQMSLEIEELKDYLLKHRIKSVTFRGEYERTKTGEDFTMNEAINIDRICDGLRTIFKDEFDTDPARRRSRGLRAWQRRKMIRIRNNFLNYFTIIPELDELELEEQKELIGQLTGLVGLGEER